MNEEYLVLLEKVTLMSDIFTSKVFEELDIGIELLKPLHLISEDTEIRKYQVQKHIINPGHRSLILDFYFKTNKGAINVEIENDKTRATPLRARYHASALDVFISRPNKKFKKVKEVTVIFICDFDYFGLGEPYYVVNRKIENTAITVNDRTKIIYINGEYKGDDEIGRLVHDLHCDKADDIYNEVLRKQVRFYKETKEGQKIMCKIMDEFEKKVEARSIEKGRAEGRDEGRAEGKTEERLNNLKNIMNNLKLSLEDALKALGIPEIEWNNYQQLLVE